jgi:hypothetical protein
MYHLQLTPKSYELMTSSVSTLLVKPSAILMGCIKSDLKTGISEYP